MPTYIAGFEIDAVLNEDRMSECEITDHPVEKGVSITDHARVKPKTVSLECVVSDTPVGALAERRGLAPADEIARELADQFSPSTDYVSSDAARAFIETLLTNREPVMISTEWTRADGSKGYKAFDNMMIQSVTESITPETGDACSLTVAFKQITFVTNNRTTVKVAVPRAKKKNDKGNKGSKEAKKVPPDNRTMFKKFLQTSAQFVAGDSDDLDAIDSVR